VFILRERGVLYFFVIEIKKEMSQLEHAPARRDSQKIHRNLWKHKLLEEELTIIVLTYKSYSKWQAASVERHQRFYIVGRWGWGHKFPCYVYQKMTTNNMLECRCESVL
jgi:hypothetical protein